MCIAGFGCGRVCAACNTYAWCVAAFNARWQKTFMLKSYCFIDTQGRDMLGPESAALSGYLA